MKKIRNLKLYIKFLITFGTILVLVLILGITGIVTLNSTSKTYYNSITSNDDVLAEGMDLTQNMADMRRLITLIAYRNSLTEQENTQIETLYQNTKTAGQNYLNEMKLIEETGKDRTQNIASMENILKSLEQYYALYEQIREAILSNNEVLAKQILSEMTKLGTEIIEGAYTAQREAFDILIQETEGVKEFARFQTIILFLIFIVIVIVGSIFGFTLSRIIRKPIERLRDVALEVSKGNLDVQCSTNAKDEIGDLSNAISNMSTTFNGILMDINELSSQLDKGNVNYRINEDRYEGAFKEAIISINNATNNLVEDCLYIVSAIKEFGEGNFDFKVKDFPGDKAIIKEEVLAVQNALKSVSNDISNLINAASDGNLEFRLDTSSYIGQWKETTDSLNQFVENVVIPIKETQNALNQFSIGNFSHRITNEYKGEFNNIKQTVNYTAETIGSYISEISDVLNEMAHKNFDLYIDRDYLGDFELIRKSVNLIINNLNVLTKDIIVSSEKVSAGSKQISESSISLAEGATKQAEAVEQLNSNIKFISQQATDNAENSEKANELALQAKNSADDGSQQMDNMLIAMEEINNASNSISNIIKVIDDIAFQTNILALNAAVEAARAGEHGKGFAVVAEEVRNLAARSQQAARETTELIGSSVEKVAEGSKIANNTAESLVNIVKQIEEISSLIEASTKSSKEQEKSIDEVTIGIQQIATVTQNNTATSEEAAAASQELATQAEIFYSSVSDFKLKED
ncbi:methyl-accepting chemotaxis protein [uncultured Tyzzerella sp.]|uniref:methyl-accepting chemotaxis protein n=1 Tax=uncultured Tyzzerella sp. TaxID=2321398 RepID=UPI002941D7A7|nr:methyl-accepting chemotaxis protein [uncultured Tyzzerella sp.]